MNRNARVRLPYIGITDFTSFDQVERMLAVFEKNMRPHQARRLHVGVMMSRKTLLGEETKWSAAFPPKEKIADIFASRETMNCLHYADYDEIDVAANLAEAIKWGGEGITAVQLDMLWPDPDHIARALEAADRPLEIILQVGGKALERMGDDPEEVVFQLKTYSRFLTHVLLDKSGGMGVGMDAAALLPFVRTIRTQLSDIDVGVAGGLGPSTLYLATPVFEEFPDINIDAQGRLRSSGNALDPIEWDRASEYLSKALALLE